MSEEELVTFDILTRAAPELSPEVKKVARDLLNRLKELLVLNWRQKSAARSQLKLTIEEYPGQRPSPGLHTGTLSPEVLGDLRACL
jgi:hypothetical protein